MPGKLIAPTSYSVRIVAMGADGPGDVIVSPEVYETFSDAKSHLLRDIYPRWVERRKLRFWHRLERSAQLIAHFDDHSDMVVFELLGFRSFWGNVWAPRSPHARPYRFRIIPDYWGFVCDEYGGDLNLKDYFPENEEVKRLVKVFADDWLSPHDRVWGIGGDEESIRDYDWETFRAFGDKLCVQMKSAIGDAGEVFFEKACDDPTKNGSEFRVVIME